MITKWKLLLVALVLINAEKCRNGGNKLVIKSENQRSFWCSECKNGASGKSCEICPLGSRDRHGKCKNCHCDPLTSFGSCSKKGRCNCLPRFKGKKCNKCAEGFENFPECNPIGEHLQCMCDARSSWSICPLEKEPCRCLSTKYSGKYCEKCAEGRHNFPECELANHKISSTDISLVDENSELLQRHARMLRGPRNRRNTFDPKLRLHELQILYTTMYENWKSLSRHVSQRSIYLNTFLMDSEGMVPAFHSSIVALEKMVGNLQKNMCEKVTSWTFYTEYTDKYEKTVSEVEKNIRELNKVIETMLSGPESFEELGANSDNILDSQDEFDAIEADFDKASEDFDIIYDLIMEQSEEITCRARYLEYLYDIVVSFDESSESPPEPEGIAECEEKVEMSEFLEQFLQDKELLDSIDDYSQKLRVAVIRNTHKMNKIDLFLQQFHELEFDKLESEASNLTCLVDTIEYLNQEFCSFDYEFEEGDCPKKPEINKKIICEDRQVQNISELIETYTSLIKMYEIAANESIEILTQNGEDIQRFAKNRKLDALTSGENYLPNGVYKNYQTKIEKIISSYEDEIVSLEANLEVLVEPSEIIKKYADVCEDIYGTRNLEKCSKKAGLGKRKKRSDDEDFFEGSGIEYISVEIDQESGDYGSGDGPPINPIANILVCPEGSSQSESCKKQNLLVEAKKEYEILLSFENSNAHTIRIEKIFDEKVLVDFNRWCPSIEMMKVDPFLTKDGKIETDFEQILEECSSDQTTIYKQYQATISSEISGDDLANEEIKNFKVPDIETKCEDEDLCVENKNGKYFDGDKAIIEVEKTEEKYLEKTVTAIGGLLGQPATWPSCPEDLSLETYIDSYGLYNCPLNNFDQDVQVSLDKIDNLQNARKAFENKEAEIDDLILNVQNMAALAKSLIESSVSEYIPTEIDIPSENKKEDFDGDNVWPDAHNLPETIYESFSQSSNGLDLQFSLQTVANQYAYVYYIGSKNDFDMKESRKRRKRKKRSTREGDSIFVSIEGHETNENLLASMTAAQLRADKAVQQPIIRVDIWTKEGDHEVITAKIGKPASENFGRRIDVKLIQRLNRFELVVRATSMNDGNSKMTTDDFEDCNNAVDEGCSSTQLKLVVKDDSEIRQLFFNQKPQIIKRVKPESISYAKGNVDKCVEDSENVQSKETLYCMLDDSEFACETEFWKKMISHKNDFKYLKEYSNLNCQKIGYVGLKINEIPVGKHSAETIDLSPSAQSNILVENLNLIPAGISNETAMTHNCIRFDSDDSGIVTDGQKLGKMLKINEDSITENKESSSISFMTKLYNFDTDIDKNPLKLVQFGNYLVQLVTKDSTKTLQFINLEDKKNTKEVVMRPDDLQCDGSYCKEISIVISIGRLVYSSTLIPVYVTIFKTSMTDTTTFFAQKMNEQLDDIFAGGELASMKDLWEKLAPGSVKFFGPAKRIAKHYLIADGDHSFNKDYHAKLKDLEATDGREFVEIDPWFSNFVTKINDVTRTCQQIPKLEMYHDGTSSIIYDFYKYGDLTWASKEVDKLGIGTATYTQQSLWSIKTRGVGIRTLFELDQSCKPSETNILLQYDIRHPKDQWDDYLENPLADKFESLVVYTDCEKIFIKMLCLNYEFNLEDVNDLLISYEFMGTLSDEIFDISTAEFDIYHNGIKQDPKASGDTTCPRFDAKACKSKKCHERRLIIGNKMNNANIKFEKLEVFKPDKENFKSIVNLLQYTNLDKCESDTDSTILDGEVLYKCH